jgi:hypothetical protein
MPRSSQKIIYGSAGNPYESFDSAYMNGGFFSGIIPGDWSPPVPGVFIKETMNNLSDLGEKMGADPASWSNQPAEF